MIPFDPNTLYSFVELRKLLHGVVELPTLLDRLGLRERVFRGALWGWEIIEAARKAEPFSASGNANMPTVMAIGTRKSNRSNPVRKLSSSDLE